MQENRTFKSNNHNKSNSLPCIAVVTLIKMFMDFTALNASKHRSFVANPSNYTLWAVNNTCKSGLSWQLYLTFFVSIFVKPTADIDHMKICYVLLNGSNATSDIFYFTIEDSGKNNLIFQTCLYWHRTQGWMCLKALLWHFPSFNGFIKLKLPALSVSKVFASQRLKPVGHDARRRATICFWPTGKSSSFKGVKG